LALELFSAGCGLGIQTAWLWPGGYVLNPHIRIASMLDTALLIASALSVALMVAFSDLPS